MVSSTKNVKFRITYTMGIAAICPTTQQTSTANEKNSKKPSIVAAKTCIAGKNAAAKSHDVKVGELTLSHVKKFAKELEEAGIPQDSPVKGDFRSASIAAASIIAKVRRDDMMIQFSREYPGYAFEKNKGYGTREHYEGLRAHGLTPIHRRTFLKNFL